MKKLLTLLLMSFLFITASAQDNQPQEKDAQVKFMYSQIVGTPKLMSAKITIEIDFGQAKGFWSDNRLRGEDGKPIVFNSMVDAMNWMGNDGWEFVQAYVVTIEQQNVYHWLLKKSMNLFTPEEKADLLSKLKTKKDFKK
ncbi:MAG: hypothetical protein RRZ83_00880 [Alistipes sp.]